MFSFCVSTPTVLSLVVDTIFFLISSSGLSWIIALLSVAKLITYDCPTIFQLLYMMFSWFCSFHSTSVHGGLSSLQGNQAVHHFLLHSSIPSPSYTTICSPSPQMRDTPSFSLLSLWGTNLVVVLWDQRACSLLKLFGI